MNFVLMGGDGRSVALCRLLERAGHGAFPMALDSALPLQGPPDWQHCDGVILPLPAERGGFLNAPLAPGKLSLAGVLEAVPPGTAVFAGMAGESLRSLCSERGLPLFDYYAREELQVKNALLTAEGALSLLLSADDRAICGRRVLISGFGRIARTLAPRLSALGCRVTVAARSPEQRSWAEAMGCAAVCLEATAGDWDYVVNTVPYVLFDREKLAAMGKPTLLELASAPGGFDLAGAEELGLRLISAPGLPGKTAPESAAEAVMDTIFNMLEE